MSLEKEKQEDWKHVFRSVLNEIEEIDEDDVYSKDEYHICAKCGTVSCCVFEKVKMGKCEEVGALSFRCRECNSWEMNAKYVMKTMAKNTDVDEFEKKLENANDEYERGILILDSNPYIKDSPMKDMVRFMLEHKICNPFSSLWGDL